jgi:hypothetical protein
MVRVLHRDAPANIDSFELVVNEQGVLLTERVIAREAWVKANTEWLPPSAKTPTVVAREPTEPSKTSKPFRSSSKMIRSGSSSSGSVMPRVEPQALAISAQVVPSSQQSK